MKKIALFLLSLTVLFSCSSRQPSAGHVILIGCDAMSAVGVQRASTPNFNRMIDEGAVSVHTRCVRETVSSQNWMSMVSASPIEMHTVFNNNWVAGNLDNTPPAITNAKGLYPTIFDHIRAQRPDLRQYAYVEWTGEVRMYDRDVFDKCVLYKDCEGAVANPYDFMSMAYDDYLKDRPELLFLSLDITDHLGHVYGHESEEYLQGISRIDSLTGAFVGELERRGWMKNTVIVITADHGGLKYGHGGDDIAEFEIPVIMYGKGVTKGKVMKHAGMIYDVGATVASLLGVKLPFECHGKLFSEAFEPSDGTEYVPLPFARPFSGNTNEVSLSCDRDDVRIYYTDDWSEPDTSSTLYTGPIKVDKSMMLRSVAYRGDSRSDVAQNWYNPEGCEPSVHYKFYRNYMSNEFPDFTKFGHPDAEGYIENFSLDRLNVADLDHFAVLFTSNLVIRDEGEYTFKVISDDGARIYIDGELVIDNSSAHNSRPAYGKKTLSAGKHRIKAEFYEINKTQKFIFQYTLDNLFFRPFLMSDFDR